MEQDFSIGNTENDREEWKEIFNEKLLDDALQTLCAFLNSYGGKIIFGVDKNGVPGKLSGDFDEMQRKIFDSTKAHIKPNAYQFFNVTTHEGRIYIFVKFDQSKIYQYKHVVYKRTGSSTHALTYEETKELEQQRKNFVKETAPGFFHRITQGEFLKCNSCNYSKFSGMSIGASIGGPPQSTKCPQCGNKLISNL